MGKEIELLFREVADLTPDARERHFAQHQISTELQAEIEALLAFDTTSLAAPDCIGSAAEQYAGSVAGPSEGAQCGAYELVRLLGEGGMGAVFLARRTDGEVEQRVAIKFVRSASSPAFHERFLRERQILASLNHPGIARLYDAGHTDDGHPYLVMEYVDGVPLDAYCQKLEFRAQVKLCLLLCDAISYAHRNLVVHRDLKPSNILVDNSGLPKLLDFGIARILDKTADASMTQERIMTPDYASPEQICGTAHTTATDIYSLGAVVYRLLTGQAPHAAPAGVAEPLEARICSSEVPPASRVNAALPKDLDFILDKAMRKEVEERYPSVDALAEDLRALLESRPVRARSGSTWYRTRKFLRRYWVPLTAAIITISALSIGLLAASRERAIALRRFNDVRQLSNRLFTIDRQVLGLPGNTKVRQLIVDTSLEYLNRLAADAGSDPDLALDLGTAYMRVARVQGVPISANLGQEDNAEKNLRIAEQLIASVLRAQPDNHMAHLRAMQIAHDRMVLAEKRRPDTEALPLARQAEAWLEKYLAGGKVDEFDKQQVVIAGGNIAFWYSRKDLTEASLRLSRRTIELAKSLHLPAHAGAGQISVARALRSVGDLDGALAAIRDGVRTLEPLSTNAASATTFSLALSTEGDVLGSDQGINMGRHREAAECFDRSYRVVLPLARQDDKNTLGQLSAADRGLKLAGVVRRWNAHRALELCDEALAILARMRDNPQARQYEARALVASTDPLRQLGRSGDARKRLDAAFSKLKDLKLYPAEQVEGGSDVLNALCARAELEAGMGELQRALEIYKELAAKLMPMIKPDARLADATELSRIYQAVARLHRRARQMDAAIALDAKRLDLWRGWRAKLPGNAYVLRQLAMTSE